MFRLLLGLAIGVAVGFKALYILRYCKEMCQGQFQQFHDASHEEEPG